VAGQFDDYHATHRTRGSKLFINPLMTLYWCFRLDPVAERLYPKDLYWTHTIEEVSNGIRGCGAVALGTAINFATGRPFSVRMTSSPVVASRTSRGNRVPASSIEITVIACCSTGSLTLHHSASAR
jgi:hypothetical protein